MKKLIAILLCLVLVLPIFGCANKTSSVLKVGFGRVDITPPDGMRIPMRGYGNPAERLSSGILDRIYATCVAFTDVNDNTILLYHMDFCSTGYDDLMMMKRPISKATGVPVSNIMISATHSHSSPELAMTGNENVAAYIDMLRDWMVDAAKAAMADRAAADMYITTKKVENMNFCRHYKMKDGTIAGDNFGNHSSGYVGHVIQADDNLQMLRFTREGKKDIMLANWQVHPKYASQYTNGKHSLITADFVGKMRDYVEANLDCQFAYFSGASGNLNPSSSIPSENVVSNYTEYGNKMGEAAAEAYQNMTKVNTHNVQITSQKYTARRSTDDGPDNMQIYAFSIGDVGFVCAPYEMFSENGQQLKAGSPFKMTFVVTYANGGYGYVPAEGAYGYDSYEEKYKHYEKGTAEELVNTYVTMLKQLYETR